MMYMFVIVYIFALLINPIKAVSGQEEGVANQKDVKFNYDLNRTPSEQNLDTMVHNHPRIHKNIHNLNVFSPILGVSQNPPQKAKRKEGRYSKHTWTNAGEGLPRKRRKRNPDPLHSNPTQTECNYHTPLCGHWKDLTPKEKTYAQNKKFRANITPEQIERNKLGQKRFYGKMSPEERKQYHIQRHQKQKERISQLTPEENRERLDKDNMKRKARLKEKKRAV